MKTKLLRKCRRDVLMYSVGKGATTEYRIQTPDYHYEFSMQEHAIQQRRVLILARARYLANYSVWWSVTGRVKQY